MKRVILRLVALICGAVLFTACPRNGAVKGQLLEVYDVHGSEGKARLTVNGKVLFTTDVHVGKNGLGKTGEGDGKTPVGTLRPLTAFGIKPNPGTAMPYLDVTPTTFACDEDCEYYNEHDLRLMRQALAIAEDPFYREQAPDYDWKNHVFRTLHYLADFTERNNMHKFNKGQLAELYGYTKRLVEFIEEHPELEQNCPRLEQKLYMERISYLTGKITREEYQRVLLDIIEEQGNKKFVAREMYVTIITPLEYLLTIDADNITEEESQTLVGIYEKLVEYAFRMPKTGVLSFMLTFIHNIFRDYIIVSGGLSLKDMCLRIMAAMHPTTYVHTLNVAAITKYLTAKLIDRNPELLVGVCGAKNADEVVQNREKIEEFAYDGALLHDIGKIFIVETIITYWRKLLDSEWELIKSHTVAGASLLRRFTNTAEFAELAMGHHKWYDDSKGYPEEFHMADAKYPTLVSLLSVADCLDAATDSIGRTYKEGKSLDEVCGELEADSGTRYAPYAVELLRDPEIKNELNRLLSEGRDENYRNTYSLLKSLSL